MGIVLIFLLLFFPIRLNAKIFADVGECYACLYVFFFRIKILTLNVFSHKNNLYYKISTQKPKSINFYPDFNKKSKNRFNFLIINKINARILLGSTNILPATAITQLIRIFSAINTQINHKKINIKTYCKYYTDDLQFSIIIKTFTNVFYVLLSLFEKLFKRRKIDAKKQSD